MGPSQTVGQAIDQRPFRPDHCQFNGMPCAEIDNGGMIRRININQRRVRRYAGVARRGV